LPKVNLPPGLLKERGFFKRNKSETAQIQVFRLKSQAAAAERKAKIMQRIADRRKTEQAKAKEALEKLKGQVVGMHIEPPKTTTNTQLQGSS